MIVQETLFGIKRVKLYGLITFLLLKRSVSVFVNSIFEVFFPLHHYNIETTFKCKNCTVDLLRNYFSQNSECRTYCNCRPASPQPWVKKTKEFFNLILYSYSETSAPNVEQCFHIDSQESTVFLWSLVSICHFIQLVNVHAATLLTLTLDMVSEPEIFTPQNRNRKLKDECI